MSEPQIDGKISRRDFLFKKVFAAVATVILAGVVIDNELHKGLEVPVIPSQLADFYPIYEIHSQVRSFDQVRPKTDILWTESVIGSNIDALDNPPFYNSGLKQNPDDQDLYDIFELLEFNPLELTKKFSEQKIAIGFYDVCPTLFKKINSDNIFIDLVTEVFLQRGGNISYIIENVFETLALGYHIHEKIFPAKNEHGADASKKIQRMTRRGFEKITALLAGIVAARAASTAVGMVFTDASAAKENAVARIANRLAAMTNHVNPLNLTLELRNAIWAKKMLYASRILSQNDKEKLLEGYLAGVAHAGVEDFLQAGEEFTMAYIKAVLGSLPREMSKFIIVRDGQNYLFTPKNFSQIVLFNFSGPIRAEEIPRSINKQTISDERIQEILQRKVLFDPEILALGEKIET